MARFGSVAEFRTTASGARRSGSAARGAWALRSGVSLLGVALAGATLLAIPALAQTADLGGATLASPDFNIAPGNVLASTVQNGTLQLNNTSALTYAGILQDGPGVFSLQKLGNNVLTLTGTSTYSGETLINTGTLAAGAANVFSANSIVRNQGGTLDLGGFNQTVGGLTASGTVLSSGGGAATLTINVASGTVGNLFGTSIIQNAGVISVVKTGAGEQDQSFASTYTGGTTLVGGTLGVGNSAAIGTGTLTFNGPAALSILAPGITIANNIVLTSNGVINRSGDQSTLSGVISGGGSLTYSATGGYVTITGTNSYTGGTIMNGGLILAANNYALGVGNTTVNNITQFGSIGSLTIGNNFALNAQLRLIAPDSPSVLTLGGQFTGAGGLWLQSGTGTVVLNLANTYTGGTILSSGRLQVADNLSLSTGDVFVSAPATLVAGGAGLNTANGIGLGSTLSVDSNGYSYTLSGGIGDAGPGGGLRKIGAGTLTLSGVNGYTGGTEIDQGIVSIASDASLGAASGVLTLAGGNLQVTGTAGGTSTRGVVVNAPGGAIDVASAANNYTLAGIVSGAGQLGKVGLGTLTLSGVNTYTGGTAVTAGTLALANSGAVGTGTLAVTNAKLQAAANLGLGNVATFNNAVVDTQGFTVALTGPIGGSNFTKIGSGTLLLSGTNTFTSGVTASQGTLAVGSSSALGTNSVGLFGGTTLQAAVDGLTLANGIQLGGATPITIDTQANTLTLTGNTIFGSTPIVLNKIGSGTLVETGTIGAGPADSFNINAGKLTFNGTLTGGALNVASGATLTGTGTASGGTVTIANGGILAPGGATPGTLTVNNLVLNNASVLNYRFGQAGVVGGANNDLIIVNNNLVLDGVLNVTAAPSFTNGTYTLFTYGTVTDNGLTLAPLPSGFTGTVVINPGAVVLQAVGNFLQYWDGTGAVADGIVTGGSGTWNSGSFNWTNATGTSNSVWAGQAAVFGTVGGNVNVVGSQNFVRLTFAVDGYHLSGSGLVVGAPGEIDTTASTTTAIIDNAISGAGSLTKQGAGTLVLNGANSFTDLGISGGKVVVGTNTAAGLGGISMAGGTTLAAGVSGLTLANAISTAVAGTIDSGAGVFTLGGPIAGPGSITKIGAGNLVLNGNNSFNNLGISTGTVTVGTSTAAGVGGISLAGGTTLAAGVSGLVLGNAISTAGAGTIDSGAGVFTLSNTIVGPGSITKVGTGNLVLNGSNSFTDLGISAGTVTVGTNTAAGTGGISMGGGTTLAAGVSGLVLTNTVATAGAGTINSGAGVFTLGGPIAGPGSITKTGAGNLVLNGNNSFTNLGIASGTVTVGTNTAAGNGGISMSGGTTLAAGVSGLVLTNAVSTAGSGTINGGTGIFTLSGPVAGPGSITSTGPGNLVLNGNNSFTNLGISSGTVTVGTSTAAGIGGISMGAGTTLAAGTSGLVLTNAVSTAGAGTINSGTGVFTLNGPIAGPGSITKTGSGNLVLGAANSFTDLGVSAGTVTLGNNLSAGSTGGISLAGGTTLAVGVSGLVVTNAVSTAGAGTIDSGSGVFTLGGTIVGPGSITKIGSGTLTLGGTNSYAGTTTVAGGTLAVNGINSGGGAVTVQSGATLTGGGSIAGTVTVANGATIAPGNGIGTLTVGGLSLGSTSNLNYQLGQANVIGGAFNDLIQVNGNLTLAGQLTVANSGSFGSGVYRLINYTGGLTDNGLTIASLPGVFAGTIQTVAPGAVNLLITAPGALVQYWDGADTTGNGVINGGTGTWNAAGTNWTTPAPSTINSAWAGGVAVFSAVSGTVSVVGTQAFQGLQFATSGYTLNGGTLAATGGAFVSVDTGIATINSVISGPGSLTKQGAGNLVLGAANSFTNLGISAGTVTLGNNLSAGSTGGISMGGGTTLAAGVSGLVVTNAISTAGAGTIDSGAGVFTLGGPILGPGSITKIGAGNLVLNGNNSFTDLGIKTGTVTVGTNTAAGNGGISMSGGTTLAAGTSGLVLGNAISTAGAATINGGAGVFTLGGTILGAGSITSTGPGNLVLNGNNSFTNLGISSGTVTVGTSTAAGIGGISMGAGTTLAAGTSGLVLTNAVLTAGAGTINSGTGVFTLNGPIAGPGSITKTGSGNLVLGAANSFTDLGVSAGTVTLGNNLSAGSTGGISLAGGTTLAAGVSGLVVTNAVSTAGAGTIDSGSGVFTLNGPIAGPGSITKIGAGNLVLGAANSFTNLGVGAGRVTLGNNLSAGSTGGISLAGGTTLAAGVSGLVVTNAISTAATGTIDSGAGVFTLNGTIVGPGSITKIGAGNLVLGAANSFTNLGISAGTVTLGNNLSAGSTGGISMGGGTTLAAGVSGLVVTNAISTAGAGTIDSGAGVFTLGGPILGPGSITKIGAGNLVLNGNNSFTDLGIKTGTVTVGTNTAAGNGGISMSGGTTLAAGTSGLVLGNAISTAGAATINGGAGVFTLNGTILGAGSITSTGPGNLVLNGNNSFTNLGISSGTVTVGTSTAAGIGGISMGAGTTLAAGTSGLVLTNFVSTAGAGLIDSGSGVFTLANNIVGPGSITKIGTGNLVLGGNNSFTNLGITTGTVTLGTSTAGGNGGISIGGGTTLAAGASGLIIANPISTAVVGTIATNAFDVTLSGPIAGPGSIVKTGSGTLTLTAASSYAGSTTVSAGTVLVNGSLTNSAVLVNSGATLGGTGSVAALMAQSGGRVAPGVGTTPGTLSVTGNAVFVAGSTFAVDVTPTAADRLTVGGTAQLAGTLAIAQTGGFIAPSTSFTILSAAGGRSGTFTTVTNTNLAYNPLVTYTTNNVLLSFAPKSLLAQAGGAFLTRNEFNVATAFDAATAAGFDPTRFQALFAAGVNVPAALNQLSGEVHSVERRVAMDDTRFVREAALDRLGNGLQAIVGNRDSATTTTADSGHSYTIWARGVGSWGSNSSDGNGSRFNTSTGGAIVGIDMGFNGGKVGALFSYISSDVKNFGLGTATVESTGGAVYAGYRQDHGLAAAAGAAYASVKSRSNRTISIPGLEQPLAARSDGNTYQAFADVSYDLAAGATTRIEPFLRFAWVALDTAPFSETGGVAAVSSFKGKGDTDVETAGLRGSVAMGSFGGFALKASAGIQHTGGDRSPTALLALAGTNSYAAINATPVDKWAFAGDLSAEFRLAPTATFAVGYSGINGKRTSDNGVRGTLTFGF